MKKTLPLLVLLSFVFSSNVTAQENCGNTLPAFTPTATTYIELGDLAMIPALQNGLNLLATIEYAVTIDGQPATDGYGDEILGFLPSTATTFDPQSFGVTTGQTICLQPVSYEISNVQNLVQAILNSTLCCSIVNAVVPDFCDNLRASGIEMGSDIEDLSDVLDLLAIFSGDPSATVSVQGFILEVDTLNSDAAILPGFCGGGNLPLCYGVPTILIPGETVCYTVRAELDAKVCLEGPFNGTDMNDGMRANGVLPLTEPFSATGDYTFTNPDYIGISVNSFLFDLGGPTAIVDWAFVEIRDKNSPHDLLSSRPVLLKRNGDIVDLNGVAKPKFDVGNDDYFVTIRHLNHIDATTSTAVSLASTVDFKTNSAYLDGTKFDANSGMYLLYAGDANGDGTVDAADRSETWNGRNTTGYLLMDCDLTGNVDASDRSVTWNNRNTQTPDL